MRLGRGGFGCDVCGRAGAEVEGGKETDDIHLGLDRAGESAAVPIVIGAQMSSEDEM